LNYAEPNQVYETILYSAKLDI